MRNWYESLFENYAETYEKEDFTKGTLGEADFIEQEINFDKARRILDIGCGTGRHTIELAKRGYQVMGVDLSETQLALARQKAAAQNLKIELVQKDARRLDFIAEFEIVIMICEGAFSLMETDEENYTILQNAARALKKNGKLIFTNLNVLYPLYHSVKDFINDNSTTTTTDDHHFDLMTFRDYSTIKVTDDLGQHKTIRCNERYYAPSEITWMLKSLGFKQIDIYGCKLGNFSRDHSLTVDDFEMLVIAEMS